MKSKLLLGVLILWVTTTGVCRADPIRIGLSLGLTGKYMQESNFQRQAFSLWKNHINQSGGILGRQVILIIYDDRSDKETAKELYRRMIEKEKLDLLFLPYSSLLTMAVLPITEKHGYPMLTSGASSDSIWQQGYRYVFGVFPVASRYALGFIEMIATYGFSKVAIVSADDPFSIGVAAGAERWARWLDMDIVLRKPFKKGTRDLDSVAQAAKDAGAHAVVMCGHFYESVHMRKAMKRIDWYPKAYYASVGPAFPAYYNQLGEDAEKTFTSTNWHYSEKLSFPGAKAFYESFTATYNREPSYQAATAYAAGMILKAAIEKAGSLDRESIRDTLSTMDIFTIIGRYGVDRTGMQIKHFQILLQRINGRQEVVWPLNLRTAQPIFP